jgi:hypothetical protein
MALHFGVHHSGEPSISETFSGRAAFSKDRIISGTLSGNKTNKKANKTPGDQNRRTISAMNFSDNPNNSRQLLQGAPPNRAAAVKEEARRQLGGATFQSSPSGRRAGGDWGRGRPARGEKAKKKTSETPNVFHNLPSSGAPGSRTSGSHALLVQKAPRHFRGCGILPRHRRWSAGGKQCKEVDQVLSLSPVGARAARLLSLRGIQPEGQWLKPLDTRKPTLAHFRHQPTKVEI